MKNACDIENLHNPYYENPTMKMLGGNYYVGVFNEKIFSQLDEILEARTSICDHGTAMDVFMLGYIYGKRAERARRKHMTSCAK